MKVGRELFYPGVIGCKKLITKYDDYKNIIQKECYDVENKIIQISRYVYTYDSVGNWIKQEKSVWKNEDELLKTEMDERIIEYY